MQQTTLGTMALHRERDRRLADAFDGNRNIEIFTRPRRRTQIAFRMDERRADAPCGVHHIEAGANAIDHPGIDRTERIIGEARRIDDESKPEAGPQNAERLVKKDNVDVLIGTVHSGVQMGIHKVVRESGTLTIIPNAGNNDVTRSLCARNVFRTSFTNWQPAYGMGVALAKKGAKRAAFITWDYAAGQESGAAFKEGFEKGGGTFVRMLTLNFPETNFQPLLAQVPGLDVDAVGAFFAGGGAVQFVKEYAAAQLKPALCGAGFLTEGTLPAQGKAAEGIETALHYGDSLTGAKNEAFMKAFRAKAGRDADVYAVQGYDAAQLLAVGLDAVKGDLDNEAGLYKAMRGAKLESPRGPISFSDSQNVIQNIYLRRVENGLNKVVGVAVEALADPGTGCKM